MIGLICVEEGNAPFIKKYLELLEERKLEYEIILWNRNGKNTSNISNSVVYSRHSKRSVSPLKKIPAFFGFRKFVLKRINIQKYEKIIFLTTLSAFFLPKKVFNKYEGKYILDYRDSSYEYISFFKKHLSYIINKSAFTCISSEGFLNILPESNKYVYTHNYKENELSNEVETYIKKNNKETLIVSYIGVLREIDYMKNLINQFGNDNRFILNIHGGGEIFEELKSFASLYSNVNITGKYVEEQKVDLIRQSDILCYNYPPSYVNSYALANKFYDGLIYKKLMYGDIDTFSGKIINENYLGISLSKDDTNKNDKILNFYHNLNVEKFMENSHVFLHKVVHEEIECMNKINIFLERK